MICGRVGLMEIGDRSGLIANRIRTQAALRFGLQTLNELRHDTDKAAAGQWRMQRAVRTQRPQFSSASRRTASLIGFLLLSQSRDGPER